MYLTTGVYRQNQLKLFDLKDASKNKQQTYEQKLTIEKGARIYADLKKEVTQAGILKRDYGFYALTSAFAYSGFFASIWLFYAQNNFFILVAIALFLTFFTIQMGGILHDCVHRAIFKSAKVNDVYGYISGFLIGVIYDAWKDRHNTHHAHPNQEEEDPDIEIPFLALNKERYEEKSYIEKLATPYQAYLYYPLGVLVGYTIRLGGLSYFGSKFKPSYIWKIALFTAGAFFWFVLPFLAFDMAKALIFFFVVNGTMGIYMANIFAPNHKGMPQLTQDQKLSFLEQQIITARNIKGGFFTDIFLIGLNYQTEHHLFPDCPRNKLKLLIPYVKKVCEKNGLKYTQVSLVESNKMIIGELNKVALSV